MDLDSITHNGRTGSLGGRQTGFGPSLHRHPLPEPVLGLPRNVGQYVNPKLGQFGAVKIRKDAIRVDGRTGRHPNRYLGALTMCSVFRTEDPLQEAWCPTVYDASALIRRPLELEELLRIFQFPLDMDQEFRKAGFRSLRDLPFLDSLSGEMVGALLCQLWDKSMRGL